MSQADELDAWRAFIDRVRITLAFQVDLVVEPAPENHPNQAQLSVVLHVPERDTREIITVRTRRPCPRWTSDAAGIEMVFDLLDTALRHEMHESVRLDGKIVVDPHAMTAGS